MRSWVRIFGARINLDQAIRIEVKHPKLDLQILEIAFANASENITVKWVMTDPTDYDKCKEAFDQVGRFLASKE